MCIYVYIYMSIYCLLGDCLLSLFFRLLHNGALRGQVLSKLLLVLRAVEEAVVDLLDPIGSIYIYIYYICIHPGKEIV